MEARLVIGITAYTLPHPEPPHSALYALGHRYARALQDSGGAPLIVPPGLSEDSLREIFNRLDGLLLSGGGDMDPALYGELPQAQLLNVSAERDQCELALARWAVEEQKSALCICRGIQVLNVALGGSLIQDIAAQLPQALQHNFDSKVIPHDHIAHTINVQAGSRLAGVLGAETAQVNSWHHQAIKRLGDGLQVTAHSPDGIIEAVEIPGQRFTIGVQWHPEWLYDQWPAMQRLFAALVKASMGL